MVAAMRAMAACLVLAAALGVALGRTRHHGCAPPPAPAPAELTAMVREAELVLTGKVSASEGEGRYLVRVKRLLKGSLDGDDDDAAVARLLASAEERTVDVSVPGWDPRCGGGLRLHQTAIFLAKRLARAGAYVAVQLVSWPLGLTLRNLDKVNAAVKDIVYKPRPPVIDEPCEKTYCQFGADCVTRADGTPHCECPHDCPPAFTPVCGTDGVTYSNHCLLRLHACRHGRNIRVQYGGECGARSRPKGHNDE